MKSFSKKGYLCYFLKRKDRIKMKRKKSDEAVQLGMIDVGAITPNLCFCRENSLSVNKVHQREAPLEMLLTNWSLFQLFPTSLRSPFLTQKPSGSFHLHRLDSTNEGPPTVSQTHSEDGTKMNGWPPNLHCSTKPIKTSLFCCRTSRTVRQALTFTVQKSHDSRRIIVTMEAMKRPLSMSQSK